MSKEQHINSTRIISLSSYEPPVIVESKKDAWVGWGAENDYYSFLMDCYTNSPTNNAVINNIIKLVYGKGLTALNASQKPNDYAHMINLIKKDVQRQVITDLKMLGQFAIQVIYSKDRKSIAQIEHMPVQLIRAEKCNSEGMIEAYWYSDDWCDTKAYPPKRIPAFGTSKEGLEILFMKPYSVGMKYYAYPDYQGSIPYAVLEKNIAEYLINEVQNGFSGTKVVNFNNGVPTEEQMDERAREVNGKLSGPNGLRTIISFNESEANKTTIDDISLNDAPSHYEYLSEECLRKIMLGHNVTSPLLFGIANANGFSSNADELENSFVLYYNMVIKPIQELVIDAFNKILSYNGVNLDLHFGTLKPLEFGVAEAGVQATLSSQLSEAYIDGLIALGEDLSDDWVLIDEFDVDYDKDAEIDAEIKALNSRKPTTLSRIKAYLAEVSRGTARPNAKSEDDQWVDGIKFFSRYKYTGPSDSKNRTFCSKLVNADKLYRKEDIQMMSNLAVNPGWGPHGADTYDIWLYKGGGNCRHIWKRQVYVSFSERGGIDFNSPLVKERQQVAISKAEKAGYKIKNDALVAKAPKDMRYNGFLPDNPRFGK